MIIFVKNMKNIFVKKLIRLVTDRIFANN